MSTPAEVVAARLLAARAAYLERERDIPRSSASNRASDLAHPCLRYLVLQRTEGEKAEPVDLGTQALFMEGRVHERTVRHVLEESGVVFAGTESGFPPNAYKLTGHVDALVPQALYRSTDDDAGKWSPVRIGGWVNADGNEVEPLTEVRHVEVGVEIKSVNPFDYSRLRTWEDFRDSDRFFIVKWWGQAQVYMFLSDTNEWIFLLKNKQNGEWKAIIVPADLSEQERLLDRAVEINKHVDQGTLPDFVDDPSVCRRCHFYGRVCRPSLSYGPGAQVITHPAIIEALEAIAETERPAATHRAAREKFREILETLTRGASHVLILGNYRVEVTWKDAVMKFKYRRVTPTADPGEED